ncbi:hypothetical protein L596_024947 [Steinernema carpocapsae]|uniref:Uncharacterized protein n=1 Tax=Steinernema carpocapsae TaxID=34508 RepID=A0A4U5M6B8_STECR|nr:hypothetical protein L596_024947 [Steinernema carpocapsae]
MRLLLILSLQLAIIVLGADSSWDSKPLYFRTFTVPAKSDHQQRANQLVDYLKGALRRGNTLVEEFNRYIRLYGYNKGRSEGIPGALRKTLENYKKTEEYWMKEKLGGILSFEKIFKEYGEKCDWYCQHSSGVALDNLKGNRKFLDLAEFLLGMIERKPEATRERLASIYPSFSIDDRYVPGLECVKGQIWWNSDVYKYYDQLYITFDGPAACFIREKRVNPAWILASVGLLVAVVGCMICCIKSYFWPFYMWIKRKEAFVKMKNPQKSVDTTPSALSVESLA